MPDKKKVVIFLLLVTAYSSYSAYLYLRPPFQAEPIDELADKGKIVWQENNCTACHQIYGLGGYLGPDLTNVYSKRGAEYIKAFVKGGTPIMPSFKLSEEDMSALLVFLEHVDQSGSSDPRNFRIHFNGTIEQ